MIGTLATATLSTVGPVSPIPVAGYSFWLDADDATSFTFSSSNVVSSWADKSVNANNATQATVAYQPTREASVLNGKAGVRFSAASTKSLSLATKIGADTSTLFLVLSTPSGITNTSVVGAPIFSTNANGVAGNQGIGLGGNWTGAWSNERVSWYAQNAGNASIGIAQNSSNISAGGHVMSFDMDASVNSRDYRLDNTSQSMTSTGSWTGILYPGQYSVIGNDQPSGAGDNFLGDLCEIILYPTQLNSTDITSVYNYLKAKWGTP